MAISDEWMNRLLMYDFISSKKGRGTSSLLISNLGKARNKKRTRRQVEVSEVRSEGTVSHQVSGAFAPMDIARFSKKRKLNNEDLAPVQEQVMIQNLDHDLTDNQVLQMQG